MKRKLMILLIAILLFAICFTACRRNEEEEEVIPVERVEITNEGQKNSAQHGDYLVVYPDANGERRIKIDYQVYPDNASNTKVDFAYEEIEGITVDEYGVVTFSKPGVIKVRIIATDGSNAEDTLLIIAK